LEATRPLLTAAIPTWNRSGDLALTLEQQSRELYTAKENSVEILVGDHFCTDDAPQVVQVFALPVSPFRSIRNLENVGSDVNIAQCFNLARGKYVLILVDDDLLLDGTLAPLCSYLESGEHGVICLRPYGYDRDFRREHPGGSALRKFADTGDFLVAICPYLTLISSCAINKSLAADVDAHDYCGGNLVQVHLVIQASLRSEKNLFADDYRIACKRKNSGGYDFSQVPQLYNFDHGRAFRSCRVSISFLLKQLL
jgi:abequosyltransferase